MGTERPGEVSMDCSLFLSLIELARSAATKSIKADIDRIGREVVGTCKAELLTKRCQGYDGHPGSHCFVHAGRLSLTWEDPF